jgi:hypothetical protein
VPACDQDSPELTVCEPGHWCGVLFRAAQRRSAWRERLEKITIECKRAPDRRRIYRGMPDLGSGRSLRYAQQKRRDSGGLKSDVS